MSLKVTLNIKELENHEWQYKKQSTFSWQC